MLIWLNENVRLSQCTVFLRENVLLGRDVNSVVAKVQVTELEYAVYVVQ